MTAGAPLPGPDSAAAAASPLPSPPAFATDWVDPRLRDAYILVHAVLSENIDQPGSVRSDLQKALDKIDEADGWLEMQAKGLLG